MVVRSGLGRMRARLDEAKECDTVGGEVGLSGSGQRCLGAQELIGRRHWAVMVWSQPGTGTGRRVLAVREGEGTSVAACWAGREWNVVEPRTQRRMNQRSEGTGCML